MKDYESMSDFEVNSEVAAYDAGGRRFLQDFDSKSDVACYTSSGIHIATKNYCNNPSDAWPVILDNQISITDPVVLGVDKDCGEWMASKWYPSLAGTLECQHKNPLRAAMIVFLMMQESKDE